MASGMESGWIRRWLALAAVFSGVPAAVAEPLYHTFNFPHGPGPSYIILRSVQHPHPCPAPTSIPLPLVASLLLRFPFLVVIFPG